MGLFEMFQMKIIVELATKAGSIGNMRGYKRHVKTVSNGNFEYIIRHNDFNEWRLPVNMPIYCVS